VTSPSSIRFESKNVRLVYALDGEERLLLDEYLTALRSFVVHGPGADFNYDALSGPKLSWAQVVDAASMLPAFAERRLVVVQQADTLSFGEADRFLSYLGNPNPSTVLVLVGERFDARTKVYKSIAKVGQTVRFARPKPREMPDFVRGRALGLGHAMDLRAIRTLVEHVGSDASAAIRSLELLSLYVGPDSKRPIRAEDVQALISVTREDSIFDLVDAIGDGNPAAALTLLKQMLGMNREHPLRVLALVARHQRQLLLAKEGLLSGLSSEELQSRVGIPSFFMGRLLGQARMQSIHQLVRGLEMIRQTDERLKSRGGTGALVMDQLVFDLISQEAPHARSC
jgi:DNA polymerase III subunit delta